MLLKKKQLGSHQRQVAFFSLSGTIFPCRSTSSTKQYTADALMFACMKVCCNMSCVLSCMVKTMPLYMVPTQNLLFFKRH